MTLRSVVLARSFTGLLLAAFVVLAAASAFAQPQRMSAEDRTKKLTEQLSLNVDQAKKVLAINKRSEEEIRKIFESAEGDRESMPRNHARASREGEQGDRSPSHRRAEDEIREIEEAGPAPAGW